MAISKRTMQRMKKLIRNAVKYGTPIHLTFRVEDGYDAETVASAAELHRLIEQQQQRHGHEPHASIVVKNAH